MIAPPKNRNAHLASAWTAGIALMFLVIGTQGAMTPLLPEVKTEIAQIDLGDEVMLEEFNPPAAVEAVVEPVPEELIEEVEIPPLPEIAAPLTPPMMVELTPLEPIIEKPDPNARKPQPRPVERRPVTQPRPQTAPQLFPGGGSGRFPSPYYPVSARSAGLQGSLRLLVTVETSGLPGSVTITSSSGHVTLDAAARDHVQRRWRWPAGEVRRYIVPIKFVLQ